MSTPFSIPNLNQYVKTGSDAELNSVTFSDGTSQTTAGGVQSKIETAGVGATGKVECTEGSVVTNIAGNIIECSASEVKLKQNLKFNDNTTQSTAFIPILHQITQKTYEDAGAGGGNNILVSIGNPDSDDGDSKNGLIDDLTTEITMKSSTSSVKVEVIINGEWSDRPFDALLCLERYNVTTGVKLVLRVATDGLRGLGISPFVISYQNEIASTLDSANIQYVDNLPASVGDVIRYSPVLVNCHGTGSSMNFMINRVYNTNNALNYERVMSSVILTEMEFTSQ